MGVTFSTLTVTWK